MRLFGKAALTAASIALGFSLVGISLRLAPGVTQIDESNFDTTFTTEWLDLTNLAISALLVGALAVWSWRWALLALAGMVSAELLWASQVMSRYQESGWSDGLEIFAFLYPVAGAFVGWVALGIGGVIGWSLRRPAPSGPNGPLGLR